jgi:predicted CopG family antitoxin
MNGVRSNLTGLSGIGGLNMNNMNNLNNMNNMNINNINVNNMNLHHQQMNNLGLPLNSTLNASTSSNLNSTTNNILNQQQLHSTLNLINHNTHLPQLNHITNLTHLKNLNNYTNLQNNLNSSLQNNLNPLNSSLNSNINNMGQFNISQLITQNLNMNFTNYNNYNIQLNPVSDARTPNLNSPLNIKIDTTPSALNSVNSNYKISHNTNNILTPKNLMSEISRMNTHSTNQGSDKNSNSLIMQSDKESMIVEENMKIQIDQCSSSINVVSHQQNSILMSNSPNYLSRKKKRRIFKIQKIERRDRDKKSKIKIRREILDAVHSIEAVEDHNSEDFNINKIRSTNNFQESYSHSQEYSNKLKIPNFDFKQKLSEEHPPQSPQENDNFLQDSEDEDSHYNSRQNPNSLISISKEVYSYLKNMKESKGSEVTEYILEHLKKSQNNLSFKNIQRRVYDAINVMNAVGIIYKDRNNLMFRGGMENLRLGSKPKPKNESKILKEKIKNKINSINSKQHELVALCTKVRKFKKLIFKTFRLFSIFYHKNFYH